MKWMDFNRDGKVDVTEQFLAAEMLCSSREEHEALFGDSGDFETDEEDIFYDDLEMAGLDTVELELMDEDERRDTIEAAGFDPDDYDF